MQDQQHPCARKEMHQLPDIPVHQFLIYFNNKLSLGTFLNSHDCLDSQL